MKILMVCLGNICRSPLAEGILRQKVQKLKLSHINTDSAGTSAYHAGESPDARMQKTAQEKGVNITDLRARQFVVADFDNFDLIYAMDEANYENILKLARSEEDKGKVKMILNEVTPGTNAAVPDPYFGGDEGFYHVYDLLDKATDVIIEKYGKG